MSHCKQPGCKFIPWRRRLCYQHFRESQGWFFDATRKIFVKLETRPHAMSETR